MDNVKKKKSLMAGPPKWIFLQLLEKCNLRCKMCYEWGNTGSYHDKNQLEQLDIGVLKKVIDECGYSKPHYELFGGEPLLYKDIDLLLKLIKEKGSTVDIPTNGTLLAEYAEMLVNREPDKLWISLDGTREINDYQRGTGVYDKIIDGINKVYDLRTQQGKAYPKIGISTTVTPNNYMSLDDLFLNELDLTKIDYISLELQAYVIPERHEAYKVLLKEEFNTEDAPISKGLIADVEGFKEINMPILVEKFDLIRDMCKKNDVLFNTFPQKITEESVSYYFNAQWEKIPGIRKRCVFPWVSTEIAANGDVASCHAMYDLTYGNVNEESLIDIWHNDKYEKFRSIMKKKLLPICPGCCLYYNQNFGKG